MAHKVGVRREFTACAVAAFVLSIEACGDGGAHAPLAGDVDASSTSDGAIEPDARDAPVEAANDAAATEAPASDAPASDGGAETTLADATPDAPAAESTSGCAPAPLSGWSPPAYVHAAPAHAAACVAPTSVAADYFAACLGPDASPDSCTTFLGQVFPSPDASCLACLRSAEAAAHYSAEITRVVPTIDVAGCVESNDGAAGLTCAQSIQAADACVEAACKASCPVTDRASESAYRACTIAARTSAGCSSFASAADACVAVEKGKSTVAATCLAPAPSDAFAAIAAWFCGE